MSVSGREARALSLMVHGPYGDEDTSAIQAPAGAAVGRTRLAVQPSLSDGQDHSHRSDAAAAVVGTSTGEVPEIPVLTLGRARPHMAKK